MSTATDEQVAVIRRGWMGTAVAVAPEVAGLTDFIEDRLVDLESRGELTENDLLAVVEAAAQMVLASGNPDQARDTSRRMRRTVYEFLLALDASTAEEAAEGAPQALAPHGHQAASSGALEQLVLPPAHDDGFLDEWQPAPDPAAAGAGEADGLAWEGVGRRRSPSPLPSGGEPADGDEVSPVVAPRAGFHLTDPVDLLADDPTATQPALEEQPAELAAPPAISEQGGAAALTTRVSAPEAADEFEELAGPAPPKPSLPVQTPAAWTARFSDAARPLPAYSEPSLVPDIWADDAGLESADHSDADDFALSASDGADSRGDGVAAATPTGWRVRKPELVGEGGRRGSSGDLPADSWQAADTETEPPPDLSEPRREIEELLRRKKYDQTGAVLQQLAQDRGGRAVAELALDIGDRCRAMGKRMAATSCYLAASRAEPVFEEPLSRLADVCIDDRDVDLAVSYLERVARLIRVRGDIKGALRVYRRIHAIAPYRDDILDLLMRAQSTGRLDP